jgi:GxxExxY protein
MIYVYGDTMDKDLEAICDLIFQMACDVNKTCFYFAAESSIEKIYQQCFAYELNKAKLKYHSEVTIEVMYKSFPLKDLRADFVLHPGGKNKFTKDIIIEVKHSDQTKGNKDKARLQLFGYLHNAPIHSASMLSGIEYGVVLHWPVADPKATWDGVSTDGEIQNPTPEPRMELWKTKTKPKNATKFELLKQWN